MSRGSHTKQRTARVFSAETNGCGDRIFQCALWTADGFAFCEVIAAPEQVKHLGGLRKLVASVLRADKVVISRGVR